MDGLYILIGIVAFIVWLFYWLNYRPKRCPYCGKFSRPTLREGAIFKEYYCNKCETNFWR